MTLQQVQATAPAAPPLELYVTANWMILEGSVVDKGAGPVPT